MPEVCDVEDELLEFEDEESLDDEDEFDEELLDEFDDELLDEFDDELLDEFEDEESLDEDESVDVADESVAEDDESVDEEDESLDEDESVDEEDESVAEDEESVDVADESVAEDDESVDVADESVAEDEESVDVADESVDVADESAADEDASPVDVVVVAAPLIWPRLESPVSSSPSRASWMPRPASWVWLVPNPPTACAAPAAVRDAPAMITALAATRTRRTRVLLVIWLLPPVAHLVMGQRSGPAQQGRRNHWTGPRSHASQKSACQYATLPSFR
ncbi:hypothetical protein [Streptomyces sp. NPDC004284]|uniref:hypothetical protein n=1 Tax=Streptomyces sp. NPDC004284 TaxID=3364695 RepID=UPI00368E2F40